MRWDLWTKNKKKKKRRNKNSISLQLTLKAIHGCSISMKDTKLCMIMIKSEPTISSSSHIQKMMAIYAWRKISMCRKMINQLIRQWFDFPYKQQDILAIHAYGRSKNNKFQKYRPGLTKKEVLKALIHFVTFWLESIWKYSPISEEWNRKTSQTIQWQKETSMRRKSRSKVQRAWLIWQILSSIMGWWKLVGLKRQK